MLKGFTESIYKQMVDFKPGRVIFGDEQRDKILYEAKRVRVKDYLLTARIDEGGQFYQNTVTTTANWYFVLTGAKYWAETFPYEDTTGEFPRIGLKFENFYPTSPFGTEAENMGMVQSRLVFGENKTRFEELKNLYYSLGERVTMSAIFKQTTAQNTLGACRVHLLLTGLEFNLQDEGCE